MSKGERRERQKIGWVRACDRETGRIGSDTCKHLHDAIHTVYYAVVHTRPTHTAVL